MSDILGVAGAFFVCAVIVIALVIAAIKGV